MLKITQEDLLAEASVPALIEKGVNVQSNIPTNTYLGVSSLLF